MSYADIALMSTHGVSVSGDTALHRAGTALDSKCFHEHIRVQLLPRSPMSSFPSLPAFETVSDGPRVAALVQHPVRRRILALARTPMSATEMAGRLGLTRQRV